MTENRKIENDTPYGQAIYVPFFPRTNASFATNPMFAGIPKPALDKYRSATEKLDKGDAEAALSSFDQAIGLHPQFAPAFQQKGSILLKKGEYDKAAEAFVKAIEIKPDYLEAKYGFGMAQFQKKNYDLSRLACTG